MALRPHRFQAVDMHVSSSAVSSGYCRDSDADSRADTNTSYTPMEDNDDNKYSKYKQPSHPNDPFSYQYSQNEIKQKFSAVVSGIDEQLGRSGIKRKIMQLCKDGDATKYAKIAGGIILAILALWFALETLMIIGSLLSSIFTSSSSSTTFTSDTTLTSTTMNSKELNNEMDALFNYLKKKDFVNFEVHLSNSIQEHCLPYLKWPLEEESSRVKLHDTFVDMFRFVASRDGHIWNKHFIAKNGEVIDPISAHFNETQHMQTCPLLQKIVERGQPKNRAAKDIQKEMQTAGYKNTNEDFRHGFRVDNVIHSIFGRSSESKAINLLGHWMRLANSNMGYDVYEIEVAIRDGMKHFCPHVSGSMTETGHNKMIAEIFQTFNTLMDAPTSTYHYYTMNSDATIFDHDEPNHVLPDGHLPCHFINVLFNNEAYSITHN